MTRITRSSMFLNVKHRLSFVIAPFYHTRVILYIYIFLYGCSFVLPPLLKIGDEDLQNDLINELNEWKLNDFQHFTLELCIRFTTRFPVNGYLPLNVPPFITSYTKPKLNDS